MFYSHYIRTWTSKGLVGYSRLQRHVFAGKRRGPDASLMSHCKSSDIQYLSPGADVVMAIIVQRNDWLEEETANMAREGLRTLVMTRKRMILRLVSSSKGGMRRRVPLKLRDNVKSTLELLRNAGIKNWMLDWG